MRWLVALEYTVYEISLYMYSVIVIHAFPNILVFFTEHSLVFQIGRKYPVHTNADHSLFQRHPTERMHVHQNQHAGLHSDTNWHGDTIHVRVRLWQRMRKRKCQRIRNYFCRLDIVGVSSFCWKCFLSEILEKNSINHELKFAFPFFKTFRTYPHKQD